MTGRLVRPGAAATALLLAAAGLTAVQAARPAGLTTAGEVRFAAVGDIGANADARTVLAGIGAGGTDLTIALGDLSYGDTGAEQVWCDLVHQNVGEGYPFQLIAGNHESDGLNGNINDFSACLPNQLPGLVGVYGRQWYVDVPQDDPLVRIIALSPDLRYPDGVWSYAAGTPRYQWTAAAIDDARADGVPWVVVAQHKPCLSVGEHSCQPGPDLNQLMLDKRVDLVLTGHEHLYQRTAQLAVRPGCTTVVPGTFDPDCVADSDNTLAKGAGTVFVTAGTGGVTPRPVYPTDPEAPYFVATNGLDTAAFGYLDVRVTADTLGAAFVTTAGTPFADAFTVTTLAPPDNLPPVATFETSCTALTCALDASAATDPDGTVTTWAWDFGDGTTGSGVTASHAFAAPGAYQVTLVVTDDDGATASVARAVEVAEAGAAYAVDTFTRTVVNGLGTAETGGPWTVSSSASNYAVDGATGRVRVPTGSTRTVTLPGVSATDTDLTVTATLDKTQTGGGFYLTAVGRQVGAAFYGARLRFLGTGEVKLSAMRGTTALANATLPGATYTGGTALRVRVQVTGIAPTTVRAKVWPLGSPEPTAWQVQTTDATAALQAPGSIGLIGYLSSSATNGPVTVLLDDLRAAPTP